MKDGWKAETSHQKRQANRGIYLVGVIDSKPQRNPTENIRMRQEVVEGKRKNAYIRVKKIQESALVRRISLHIDIHFFLTPLLLPKISSNPTSTDTMRYSKIPLRQILRLRRPHSIIICFVLVPPRVQSCHVENRKCNANPGV